jgi:hypothetical protein
MKRTFNWTGRKAIPSSLITVRLIESRIPGQPLRFTAELDGLRSLKLKPEARIYVEPYVGSSSMRFAWGSIASISPALDTSLTEVDAGHGVLFRVKVVDESEAIGRILAAADGVRPSSSDDPEGRKPLLPVEYRDLGQAIWHLDLQEGAQPVLVLNNQLPQLADRIAGDPVLQGAIVPVAVRQILEFVFEEGDSSEPWVADWRKFVADLNDGEQVDDDLDDEAFQAKLDELAMRYDERIAWVRQVKEATIDRTGGRHA